MKRRTLYVVALLLSLAAAWWVSGLDEEAAPLRPAKKAAHARPVGKLDLAALDGRRVLRGEDEAAPPRDLFAPRSFLPPPPPPPPAAAPVAPPLPYRYAGMLEDGADAAAFVADNSQIRVVRVGDLLDGRYRVTAVSRSHIEFLYLPLNTTQSLVTGATP
jgi:hypothetical protein